MSVRRIKQKRKKLLRLGRPRCWVAMGALAAYTATDGSKVALAQKPPAARQVAASRSEALPVRRYDIPGGTLETVLDRFRKISGALASVPDTSLLNIHPLV